MTTWSPEMIATLRALWPDRDLSARDLSARDLAERLDVTPAAVFGMARRLDLPSRYPARGSGATRQKRRRTGAEPFRLVAAPEPRPEPPAAAVPRPCGCAWPLWPDFTRPASPRFCGAAVIGTGSYCAEHHQLARRCRGDPWRKLPPPTLLGRLLLAA